jgi:hypothetical protein
VIRGLGITAEAVPLFMRDAGSTRDIAQAALDLASAPAPR